MIYTAIIAPTESQFNKIKYQHSNPLWINQFPSPDLEFGLVIKGPAYYNLPNWKRIYNRCIKQSIVVTAVITDYPAAYKKWLKVHKVKKAVMIYFKEQTDRYYFDGVYFAEATKRFNIALELECLCEARHINYIRNKPKFKGISR